MDAQLSGLEGVPQRATRGARHTGAMGICKKGEERKVESHDTTQMIPTRPKLCVQVTCR